MRQSLFILALLVAIPLSVFAAPRDFQTAQSEAQQQLSAMLQQEVLLADMPQLAAPRGESVADLPYYHFCDADHRAFVVVAGSDLLPAVIGYGQLDADADFDQLPDNMQYWLDGVAEIEAWLENNPVAAEAQRQALSAPKTVTVVQPIMKCQWGQNAPFNNECPKKNSKTCVVGCVATAVAQVLYTQRFPSSSKGTVSYSDCGTTRTANLEGVTYDYTKMLDKYTSSATSAQKAEVAKFCHNIGLACWTQYDPSGSSSILSCAARGLAENFQCSDVEVLDRVQYSLDEWNGMIQEELNDGRPVVLSGNSETSGHAFVLDGINSQGLYHVNWGWSGGYDGYFDVSVLRTDDTGTGATIGSGFYKYQELLVNICNPQQTNAWYCPLYIHSFEEPTQVKKGTTLSFSAVVYNYNSTEESFIPGITVLKNGSSYKEQFNTTPVTLNPTTITIKESGGFHLSMSGKTVYFSFDIPSNIANGTYKIYLSAKDPNTSTIRYLHPEHVGHNNCWILQVSGSTLTLKQEEISHKLDVSDWAFEGALTAAPTTISCKVTNSGSESFASRFMLGTIAPDKSNTDAVTVNNGPNDAITLAPNESRTLSFVYTPTQSGSITLKLWAAPYNDGYPEYTEIGSVTKEVESDGTTLSNLSMHSSLYVVTSPVYNLENLTVQVKVTNTGEAYNGKMSIRLFKSSSSTSDADMVAEITNNSVQVPKSKPTTIEVSGVLNIANLTKDTRFYAKAYYLYGDEMKLIPTNYGVTNNASVQVLVARQSGIEQVVVDEEPEDLTTATIYNVLGKPITLPASGRLRPGIYIVNGKKRVVR